MRAGWVWTDAGGPSPPSTTYHVHLARPVMPFADGGQFRRAVHVGYVETWLRWLFGALAPSHG